MGKITEIFRQYGHEYLVPYPWKPVENGTWSTGHAAIVIAHSVSTIRLGAGWRRNWAERFLFNTPC